MNHKITVIPATAIAATNAVLAHISPGIFMSEYGSVRTDDRSSGLYVEIDGRTNVGISLSVRVSFDRKYGRVRGQFPYEKAFVSMWDRDPATGRSVFPTRSFKCTFAADSLTVESD